MEIPKRKLHLSTMDFQGRTVTLQGTTISQPWQRENHLEKCLGMGYVTFQEGSFREGTGSSLTERHHFWGKNQRAKDWSSACRPECPTEVHAVLVFGGSPAKRHRWISGEPTCGQLQLMYLKKNGDWVERRRDSLVVNKGYMILYFNMYICVCVCLLHQPASDWLLMRTSLYPPREVHRGSITPDYILMKEIQHQPIGTEYPEGPLIKNCKIPGITTCSYSSRNSLG